MKQKSIIQSLLGLGILGASLASSAQNLNQEKVLSVESLYSYVAVGQEALTCLHIDEVLQKNGLNRDQVRSLRVLFGAQNWYMLSANDKNNASLVDADGDLLTTDESASFSNTASEHFSISLENISKKGLSHLIQDICLSTDRKSWIGRVRIAYKDNFFQPPVNPPPINPPPINPPPVPPPLTPQPPPPMQIHGMGAINKITPDGRVYGWACDPGSNSNTPPLRVALRIKSQASSQEVNLSTTASENINWNGGSANYGFPSSPCTNRSGFSFVMPTNLFSNQWVNLILSTDFSGPFINTEILQMQYKMPVNFDHPGIFKAGSQYYLLDASLHTACMTNDRDLYLAAQTSGQYADYGDVGAVPPQVTSITHCGDIPYPRGFFRVNSQPGVGSGQIFYSDGNQNYCYLQHPGLMSHVAYNEKINTNNVVVYNHFPRLQHLLESGNPGANNPHGVCRERGQFQINGGKEIYFTDGFGYCHMTNPNSIVKPFFNYQSFPEGQAQIGQGPDNLCPNM